MKQSMSHNEPCETLAAGSDISDAEVFAPVDPRLAQSGGPYPTQKAYIRIYKEAEHDILHEFGPAIEYDRVTPDDLDYCFTQVTMYHRTVQAVAIELNLRPHTLRQAWQKYVAMNKIYQDELGDWFQNDQAIPLMSYDPSRPEIDMEEARKLFDECDRI